jgi:pimeloyl-[acyl-carrier protein] methyl ester esterase
MSATRSETLHVDRSHGATASGSIPIVMLHGWGMNLRVFDLLRAGLACPTWAIDLAGHGQSPWWPGAADFEVQVRMVREVLPPRCVLLGWSLGAKLAMAIAAADPVRVAQLVLVAASPKFAASADWPQGMDGESLRAFDAVLAQDWRRTLEDFIELQLRGSRHAESARASIREALASHGEPRREALLTGMSLLESVDLRLLAPRIAQPTLVIAGQNDRVTSPAAARWLAATMPDARLVEVPRAGHAPMVSHAAEVAAAIQDFVPCGATSDAVAHIAGGTA